MKKILFTVLALSSLCYATEQEAPKSEEVKQKCLKELSVIKPKVAIISLTNDSDISQMLVTITKAVKDKEISAVLLAVDSTGGSMSRFAALHDLIRKAKSKKPFVGLITGLAHSGGYWVASATDYLIAHSGSEVGSIGVIWEIFKHRDPERTTKDVKAKLNVEVFYAGEYKAITNVYKDLTPDEKKYLQDNINKHYQNFIKNVAENRGLDAQNYQEWAEGKLHIAAEALEMRLIDEIGTIFEAEEKLIDLIRKKNSDSVYSPDVEYVFFDGTKEKPKN